MTPEPTLRSHANLPMGPAGGALMKTDAELVEAIRAGATEPWGEVFDRWRDSVWHVALSVTRNHSDSEDVVQATFLKAVESLDQLREPDKLRPWLCSIARSTALDRVRRPRETPSESATEAADDSVELDSKLRQDEVSDLVAAAFDGLEPRDRTALQLVERDELSGDELAAALGVSRDNAYALVHNARTRFARSVESIVVARNGGESCAELREVLGHWDGQLTPLLRKRVARHIEQCQTCTTTKDREVTRAALLNVLPLLAMPLVTANGIRGSVLDAAAAKTGAATVSSGAVVATAATKVASLVAAAAAVVAISIGAAVFVARDGGGNEASADTELVAPAEESADAPSSTPRPTPTAAAVNLADPVSTPEIPEVDEATFCELTEDLINLSSLGPASGSPADLKVYMIGTNDLLQGLATTDGAGSAMVAYAAAYQALVDTEGWNLAPLPSNPELLDLLGAVEAEVATSCPTI